MISQVSPGIQEELIRQQHEHLIEQAAHARLIQKVARANRKLPIIRRIKLKQEPVQKKAAEHLPKIAPAATLAILTAAFAVQLAFLVAL